MRYRGIYRFMAGFVRTDASAGSAMGVFASDREARKRACRLIRRGRAVGAALCLFDGAGTVGVLTSGSAGGGRNVLPSTWFRTASISKMVTAALALGLNRRGLLDMDADVSDLLGFPLRAPKWSHVPITAAMLLSHTASVRDTDLLFHPEYSLEEAAERLSFTGEEPGKAFNYSNEGAALLGAALEKAAGEDLDAILHREFGPAGTYFPSRLPMDAQLSDGIRILPRRKTLFSGSADSRAASAAPKRPGENWNRAHGGLCLRAEDLAGIARALMTDERYREMRAEVIPMGKRDPWITEGKGIFILRYPESGGRVIYGHQGLAYGAAHGVFFDPASQRGALILTSGCSLCREYVLTDLNRAVIAEYLAPPEEGVWKKR